MLPTSLISTLCSDRHALELPNKLRYGQDSNVCDIGQAPRGEKPHLTEEVNMHT